MERTYRIRTAAQLSGISEGVLRAWERRYGALKPRRMASGYRAYTDLDIELLRRLKALTEQGMAIGEAVKLLPRLRREVKSENDKGAAGMPERLTAWREAVLLAAQRLDQPAVEQLLDEAMEVLSPLTFFEELIVPLQLDVGTRWHSGEVTVAQEHLVTQAAQQRVLTLLHRAPRGSRWHVVCACYPEEDHELGLMGVALRFRHAHWRVTYLGRRTPIAELARAVEALKPDLVALSCVNEVPERALSTQTRAVLAALPAGVKLVVGGAAVMKHAALFERLKIETASDSKAWAERLWV